MGSGPPFLGAGGDPAADCLGCEGWEEEEGGAEEVEVEALDSACRKFCSCGKMIAIGCVISEDACTQRFDTRLDDL